LKKNVIYLIPFATLLLLVFLFVSCGDDKSVNLSNYYTPTPAVTQTPTPTLTPNPTSTPVPLYTYEVIEYVVEVGGIESFILQSRGSGNGTNDGYFNLFILNQDNSILAVKGDPIWFDYNNMTLREAIAITDDTQNRRAELSTEASTYFFDINGGSEMGGETYRFHTNGYDLTSSQVIHVETDAGGDLTDLINSVTNANGAAYWTGTEWGVNLTYGHMFFADQNTGERLQDFTVTEIDSSVTNLGEVFNQSFNSIQYRVIKNAYTYTIPPASDGSGPENLGSSFVIDFGIEFTDENGVLRRLHFLPGIISETPPL